MAQRFVLTMRATFALTGLFASPVALAADPADNLYVADTGHNR